MFTRLSKGDICSEKKKPFRSKGGIPKGLSLGFEGGALYRTAFLLGFFLLILTLLPFLIFNGGIFTYYGDFNSQQLPFYQMVHDSVQNGELLWNWKTDLGASLVGSYAFYLLGSPFFWLTVIFPSKAVPYLIPILLGLKYAMATLTATAWIRRFTKRGETALIGGLLYAFSSFQAYNIFFNHFHDVTAFFPLLLLTMDMAVEDKKPGYFGFAVALMAMVNYYFFTGQVVFCIGYFLLRWFLGDWRKKVGLKDFGSLLLQSILGVMTAGVILLPAVMALLGNPRTGERLLGNNLIMYNDVTRIPRGIFSTLMIGDIPARSVLFPSETAKWSSIAAYLPLFSVAGVLAFMRSKPGHWAKRLVIFSGVAFVIPVFSSFFSGFTSSVNGRWFYMPILVMAMMTAVAFEEKLDIQKGLRLVTVMILAFGVIGLLPKAGSEAGTAEWGDYANVPVFFWIFLLVSATLTLICSCIIGGSPGNNLNLESAEDLNHSGADVENAIAGKDLNYIGVDVESTISGQNLEASLVPQEEIQTDAPPPESQTQPPRNVSKLFKKNSSASRPCAEHRMVWWVAAAALVTQCTMVWCGISLGNWPPEYIEHAIRGGENITLPNGDGPLENNGNNFFRVDISEDKDNYPMFWGYGNMRAFQSTVPPSIMEFYSTIGVKRDVASRAGTDEYGLRGLFSVKYYFDWIKEGTKEVTGAEKDSVIPKAQESIMPGFKYVNTQNNFNIYENQYFLPMGFCYPGIISREVYENLPVNSRHLTLLKGLVLEEEDFNHYKGQLPVIETSQLNKVSESDYAADCKTLGDLGVWDFSYSDNGFQANLQLDSTNLVFFSVPYDPGFTAYIDGEETPIIKSNIGFMAVEAGPGNHIIQFKFIPKGLKLGLILSAIGLLTLAVRACRGDTFKPLIKTFRGNKYSE